jgi:hypothetical protein
MYYWIKVHTMFNGQWNVLVFGNHYNVLMFNAFKNNPMLSANGMF